MVQPLNDQSREAESEEEALRLRRRCARLALFAGFFSIAHVFLFAAVDERYRSEGLSTAAGLLPMVAGEACAIAGVAAGWRSRARGFSLAGVYLLGYVVNLLVAVIGVMAILMLLFFPRH